MGIKPLVVAARYKFVLMIPFLIILPAALFLSYRNLKTEYTSTAVLFVEQSLIADIFSTSDNPYASPADNRATDFNELLQTERFRLEVATLAGLPTAGAAARNSSQWEVLYGTNVYAAGRKPLIVNHTSSDPKRAELIVRSLVEGFRQRYQEDVVTKAASALKVYEATLENQRTLLDEAQRALDEYLASRPTNQPLADDVQFAALQGEVDQAQEAFNTAQQNIFDTEVQRDNAISGQDVTLSVQDEASLPQYANAINKREFIALPIAGFLIALSIAAAIYAFLLRTDSRLRTREDVAELTTVPVLVTIPDVTSERRRTWPKDFARLAAGSQGGPVV